MHHVRLLNFSEFYKHSSRGEGLPDKTVNLNDNLGEITLVAIRDSAFSRHAWLVNAFNGNTVDPNERYYKKLCCARVVSENCYGMSKEKSYKRKLNEGNTT